MKKYNFLVLTDHAKHSDQNSVYALTTELAQHEQAANVWVASRGNAKNAHFFRDNTGHQLHAFKVKDRFDFDAEGNHVIHQTEEIDIHTMDVIFLRLPRPITDDFFAFLLHDFSDKIFVNNPKGIQKTSSKAFLLHFPSLCPSMQLCKSVEAVRLAAQKEAIVLKPLKEYGGKGIVKIMDGMVHDGQRVLTLEDYLPQIQEVLEEDGMLAMKFLKNVKEGDKRILVVNGEVLASSLRLPAKDSWLCNVAQGGKSVASTVTDEEHHMIEKITPTLLENGIVFCGVDTLVDDDGKRILSEINTLSIGGFPQAGVQTGLPIVKMAIDNMIDYVNKQ